MTWIIACRFNRSFSFGDDSIPRLPWNLNASSFYSVRDADIHLTSLPIVIDASSPSFTWDEVIARYSEYAPEDVPVKRPRYLNHFRQYNRNLPTLIFVSNDHERWFQLATNSTWDSLFESVSALTRALSMDFHIVNDTTYLCFYARDRKCAKFLDLLSSVEPGIENKLRLGDLVNQLCQACRPTNLMGTGPPLEGLMVELYPFQKKTVEWMKFCEVGHGQFSSPFLKLPFVPHLSDDIFPITEFWFNRMTGECVRETEAMSMSLNTPAGGILGDMMGLGKTVMTLALILSHPKPIDTAGTLLIVPSAILNQWRQELASKAPHLKILVYRGLYVTRNGRHVPSNRIDPDADEIFDVSNLTVEQISGYDIVLTTHFNMRTEHRYANLSSERKLRHAPKYVSRQSLIPQIHWHRIVLDEAQGYQQVKWISESVSSNYRWCVSGTPIQHHSVTTLLPLLSFIGYAEGKDSPFRFSTLIDSSNIAWEYFLENIPLVMRRTVLTDVQHQIVLPMQVDRRIYLQFSAIESYHYQMILDGYDYNTTSAVDKRSILLRCREACFHPRLSQFYASHNHVVVDENHDDIPSLQVLLSDMTLKHVTEMASLCRHWIQKGIDCGLMKEILKNWKDAVVHYDECTQDLEHWRNVCMEALKGLVDKNDIFSYERPWMELQHRLLFNLASVHLHEERKAQADALFEKAEELRQKTMREATHQVESSKVKLGASPDFKQMMLSSTTFELLTGSLTAENMMTAWSDTAQYLNLNTAALAKAHEALMHILAKPLLEDYSDDAEEQAKGHEWQSIYEKLLQQRQLLTERRLGVDVQVIPLQEEMEPLTLSDGDATMGVLPLRKDIDLLTLTGRSATMSLLPLHDILQALRLLQRRPHLPQGEELLLNRAIQEMKPLIQEQQRFTTNLMSHNQRLVRLWNARVVYYRQLQKFSDQVTVPELDETTAQSQWTTFTTERLQLKKKIQSMHSRYRYLRHLRDDKNDDKDEGMKSCCICRIQPQVALLTRCGHVGCEPCLRVWVERQKKCPICIESLDPSTDLYRVVFEKTTNETVNESSDDEDIEETGDPSTAVAVPLEQSFPDLNEDAIHLRTDDGLCPALDSSIKLQKSFGTKIDAVLRYLIHLLRHSPETKSIIFSHWQSALDYMNRAISSCPELGLVARLTHTNSGIALGYASIDTFRTNPECRILLLHAQSSAAGLTLTNARHVFLLEPSLDSALTMQAMHRVYRLGQEKRTFVHRLIVRDTVEERLDQWLQHREGEEEQTAGENINDEDLLDVLLGNS